MFGSGMNKWLLVLILIIVVFQVAYSVTGMALFRGILATEMVIGGEDLMSDTGNLTLRQVGPDEPSVQTYRASFSVRESDRGSYDHLIVMVGNLNCVGYTVMVNGQTIGCAGDIVNARANIWSNFFFYTLDESLLTQDNVLELRVDGLVKRGLSNVPVVIGRHERMQRLNLYFNISNSLIITGTGMLLLSAAVAMILFSFTRKRQYFYLGMSLLCLTGSSGLFIHLAWMPIDFYAYLRMVYVLLSSVILFESLMLMKLFRYRVLAMTGCIIWLAQILCQFLIRDMTLLYNIYRAMDASLLLCLLAWVILLPLRHMIRRSIEKRFFYGCVLVTLGYGVFLLLSSVVGSFIIMLSGGVAFTAMFVVLTMLLLYRHILDYRFEATRREYQMRQLSGEIYTDVLTGLGNRRQMVERIKEGIGGCHMVVLDIDNFKDVNDILGHDVGDKVLIALARAMVRWRQSGDFIARWGGDEFVLLLPAGEVNDSVARLRELQAIASGQMLDVLPQGYGFSFSAGVLETPPGLTEAEAFRRADQALLYAKSMGNGNIVVWIGSMDGMPVRHLNIR